MKIYKHWLKIDGYSFDVEKQYNEIETYLKNYPDAKITVYQYDYNLFNKVVLLECSQDYNNLDITVNSGSNRLRRLAGKPKNITEIKNIRILNGELSRVVQKNNWRDLE